MGTDYILETTNFSGINFFFFARIAAKKEGGKENAPGSRGGEGGKVCEPDLGRKGDSAPFPARPIFCLPDSPPLYPPPICGTLLSSAPKIASLIQDPRKGEGRRFYRRGWCKERSDRPKCCRGNVCTGYFLPARIKFPVHIMEFIILSTLWKMGSPLCSGSCCGRSFPPRNF